MLRAITEAAVENPVTVHLVSALLLIAGVVMYLTIPQEIFPEFTLEKVRVITVYPGAAPEDVEELITVKIEDVIDGIDGIKTIESTSKQGISTVTVKLEASADMDRVLQDVDRAVQTISVLPPDAEDPLVEEVTWQAKEMTA